MKPASRIVLAVLTALGVVAIMAVPAGAAQGGGGVTGNVAVSPGLTLTCTPQTFTFSGVVISGTFTSAGQAAAGTVTVPTITGGSTGCDSTGMGAGHVDAFSAGIVGVGSGNANCNQAPLGRAGSYTRVGGIVLVELKCNITAGSSTTLTTVQVAAQFTPTSGNGITAAATAASFAGAYVAF